MTGRPSKYDPAYCDAIIEHMRDGASVSSFAAEIDVARSTINKWADEHEEFSEALSRAKAKCAAWWEKAARSAAIEGKGNATIIVFGLKNMGDDDWQDVSRQEHSGPGGKPMQHSVVPREMSDEELIAHIERQRQS